MPTRLLRDGIIASPRINSLSAEAELFYRRLMSVVDDFGCYYGSPANIRPAVYPLLLDDDNPFGRRYTDDQVRAYIGECVEQRLVTVYQVDGVKYLRIENFQQQTRTKPKFPHPPDSPPPGKKQTASGLLSDRQQSANNLQTDCQQPENKMRSLDEGGDVVEGEGEGAASASFEAIEDPLNRIRRRINAWFSIPVDTPWSVQGLYDLTSYANWEEDNWELLAEFMTAPLPADADKDHPLRFRHQSPEALVAKLPAALTRAIRWQKDFPHEAQGGRATRPSIERPFASPPCQQWQDLADEFLDPGWPRHLPWADIHPDTQRQLHEFYGKKMAALTETDKQSEQAPRAV